MVKVREAFPQPRRVCFQLPTGGGKMIVFAPIASRVAERGNRALVLAPRRELVRQTGEKMAFFGIEAGVIASGWPAHPDCQIQVASVPTLARRPE